MLLLSTKRKRLEDIQSKILNETVKSYDVKGFHKKGIAQIGLHTDEGIPGHVLDQDILQKRKLLSTSKEEVKKLYSSFCNTESLMLSRHMFMNSFVYQVFVADACDILLLQTPKKSYLYEHFPVVDNRAVHSLSQFLKERLVN